jgi:predicted O-methyltransferase YrrM
MSEYKFTQDWFSWAPPVWQHLIPMLSERKKFLEIGAFEGRATTWIVENMMEDGSEIVCIDTWAGGEEHVNGEMSGAEERFDHNMLMCLDKFPERRISKIKLSSYEFLGNLAMRLNDKTQRRYDFIYIDGSHIAKDVLTDACMSWPLLKKGGIMVFDDYLWGDMSRPNHVPKPAIDAFVNIFIEELKIVHVGYQLIVRRTV